MKLHCVEYDLFLLDRKKMSHIEQSSSPCLCSFLSLLQSGAAGEGEGRDAENEIRRKKEDCWKPRVTDERWPSRFKHNLKFLTTTTEEMTIIQTNI